MRKLHFNEGVFRKGNEGSLGKSKELGEGRRKRRKCVWGVRCVSVEAMGVMGIQM